MLCCTGSIGTTIFCIIGAVLVTGSPGWQDIRSEEKQPDRLKVVARLQGESPGCAEGTPEVSEISHEIAALKTRDYTIDEIIQKRLYFLVPFFIFNHDHLKDMKEEKRP